MNVTIYYKRECGRIRYFGLRKNKANSKYALSAVEWANFKIQPQKDRQER